MEDENYNEFFYSNPYTLLVRENSSDTTNHYTLFDLEDNKYPCILNTTDITWDPPNDNTIVMSILKTCDATISERSETSHIELILENKNQSIYQGFPIDIKSSNLPQQQRELILNLTKEVIVINMYVTKRINPPSCDLYKIIKEKQNQ